MKNPDQDRAKRQERRRKKIYRKRNSANDQNLLRKDSGIVNKFLSSGINSSSVYLDKENSFCLRNTRTFLLDSTFFLVVSSGACGMD